MPSYGQKWQDSIGMPDYGPSYPGGLTGVNSDFDWRNTAGAAELGAYLRNQQAGYDSALGNWSAYSGMAGRGLADQMMYGYQSGVGTNNAIRQQAAGLATNAMRDQALGALSGWQSGLPSGGDFSVSDATFNEMARTGGYSPAQIQALSAQAYRNVNEAGRQAGADMVNANAARGLTGAVGGNMAAKSAMQAGSARASAVLGILQNQVGNRLAGAQGSASNAQAQNSYANAAADRSSQMARERAGMMMAPTQESAMNMQQNVQQPDWNRMSDMWQQWQDRQPKAPDTSGARDIYDYYRNAQRGPTPVNQNTQPHLRGYGRY